VVDLLVGGVGPERMVPDGALHLREEGLDLAAVLLGVGRVEGEGHEEAASAKLTAGQRNPQEAGAFYSLCLHLTTNLD